MPELKLYTVADLREWLENNRPADGLSEHVIAPSRAWAIIHNPYVKDDDAIVAAIFENGELAAYTAVFPEMIKEQRIWWYTTLWCEPKYQGKGYGVIVVGGLKEAHDGELCMDMDGAAETQEIMRYLGYHVIYTPQYVYSAKAINTETIRGKLSAIVERCQRMVLPRKHALRKRLYKANYRIKYVDHIDMASYEFISNNSREDTFAHTQAFYNWVLANPICIESPIMGRIIEDCAFTTNYPICRLYGVQVYVEKQLVGYYLLKNTQEALEVKYLFYNSTYAEQVFNSIAEHILKFNSIGFITTDRNLTEFIKPYRLFAKYRIYNKSFAYPPTFEYDATKRFQMGDGDNFA